MLIDTKDIQKGREKMVEISLKAIREDSNIVFFQDLKKTLNYSYDIWYKLFPVDERENIPEWHLINDEINNNRITVKAKLRQKMLDSKSPAALIALYRLIGTDEEREALNIQMDQKRADERNKEKDNNVVLKIA